jgi:dUTP pyrophosphatase
MKIKTVNISENRLPEYSTIHSAGMDIRACLAESVTIMPLKRMLIRTGLFIQLPEGYEAQIRPRSGLALKNGITVLNTPGTIDADYRGEIGIIIVNLSDEPFVVNNGDRIAQMIISKYERAEMIQVERLDSTERGEGGFGHTGKG